MADVQNFKHELKEEAKLMKQSTVMVPIGRDSRILVVFMKPLLSLNLFNTECQI